MRTELIKLKRQAAKLLSDLQRDREAVLNLEGIARGEMAAAEGRVLTHAQAKERMSRWLK
jgi:predicted transcriptional regulator